MKKTVQRLMVVMAVLALTLASVTPALGANEVPTIRDIYKGTVRLVYVSQQMGSGDNMYHYRVPSGKVTKIKSSNRKVADPVFIREEEYGTSGKNQWFVIDVNKPGTAKVSYTYQGKRHKVTVKVDKWRNPVESFKVGGKDYKARFNKAYHGYVSAKLSGKTVKVVPASGWKIVRIVSNVSMPSQKDIKNGKKTPKKTVGVSVELVNKKTGVKERVDLNEA